MKIRFIVRFADSLIRKTFGRFKRLSQIFYQIEGMNFYEKNFL